MNEIKLTKAQIRVLDVIQQSIRDDGRPPTRAEISDALGFRSINAAESHLRAVSGVAILRAKITGAIADIRIDIAEARLVNDMPVFRLLTQPLTKAHSNRVCAAMRQAGFSCMLRGRK